MIPTPHVARHICCHVKRFLIPATQLSNSSNKCFTQTKRFRYPGESFYNRAGRKFSEFESSYADEANREKWKGGVRLSGISEQGKTKRFYCGVDIEPITDEDCPGWAITLDGRLVLTPLYNMPLSMPTKNLALALALEWESQWRFIKLPQMLVTQCAVMSQDQSLMDLSGHGRASAEGFLVKRIYSPDPVIVRQYGPDTHLPDPMIDRLNKRHLDPLVEWMREEWNADYNVPPPGGFFTNEDFPDLSEVTDFVKQLDAWHFTPLMRMTEDVQSFIIPFALFCNRIDLAEAVKCAVLDKEYATELHGILEGNSDEWKAHIERSLASGITFLNLLRT